MAKMVGAILPGNDTAELREFDVPTPRTRRSINKNEIVDDLRLGYQMYLS